MKVVVLSSLAYSLVNFRGALLRQMRAEGHEVIAVAPDEDEQVATRLAEMGIPLRILPMNRTGTNPLADLQTTLAYIKLLRAEKPDLVFAYTQKPIIYGGIAARCNGGVPFFALMSGLGYMFSDEGQKRALVRKVFCRLYRFGLEAASEVYVFNRDDRQDMLDAGIISPGQAVVQVPGSGIDTVQFPHQPIPDGPVTFLMISRLMRDKGVIEFLEAARQVLQRHPGTRFRIVGRAETHNQTGIGEEEVARLSAEFPVEFCGETRDVRPFLSDSSVFVLPSYYREGLPRTILEAMSTGRAVITTDLPGCRDPIEPGENGLLVKPRSSSDLAAAMCQLVEDPEKIVRMGKRSREIAEQTYDVDKVNALLLGRMGLLGRT